MSEINTERSNSTKTLSQAAVFTQLKNIFHRASLFELKNLLTGCCEMSDLFIDVKFVFHSFS